MGVSGCLGRPTEGVKSFFEAQGNLAKFEQPGKVLKVTIPIELEKQQHHVSLYHETTSLLKKLDEMPKNKG
jgi:hypothetical protein